MWRSDNGKDRIKHENISSAPNPYGAPNATTKKNIFKYFKKF